MVKILMCLIFINEEIYNMIGINMYDLIRYAFLSFGLIFVTNYEFQVWYFPYISVFLIFIFFLFSGMKHYNRYRIKIVTKHDKVSYIPQQLVRIMFIKCYVSLFYFDYRVNFIIAPEYETEEDAIECINNYSMIEKRRNSKEEISYRYIV